MNLSADIWTHLILPRVSPLTLWRVTACNKNIGRKIDEAFWRRYQFPYLYQYREVFPRLYLIGRCLDQLDEIDDMKLTQSFVRGCLDEELVRHYAEAVTNSLLLTRVCHECNLIENNKYELIRAAIREGSSKVISFLYEYYEFDSWEEREFLELALTRDELPIVVLFEHRLTVALIHIAIEFSCFAVIDHLFDTFDFYSIPHLTAEVDSMLYRLGCNEGLKSLEVTKLSNKLEML